METEGKLRWADVFVSIHDPRQSGKVRHDLVELLVVAVNAVLVGADDFVEIELWAKEKLEWLRQYLKLTRGIPSHDTFGRLFGLIDPDQFEAAFRPWVSGVIPALGADAHNLAMLKHITLSLIRMDPVKRKGGIKARRLIAATSDNYRAELFGLA